MLTNKIINLLPILVIINIELQLKMNVLQFKVCIDITDKSNNVVKTYACHTIQKLSWSLGMCYKFIIISIFYCKLHEFHSNVSAYIITFDGSPQSD